MHADSLVTLYNPTLEFICPEGHFMLPGPCLELTWQHSSTECLQTAHTWRGFKIPREPVCQGQKSLYWRSDWFWEGNCLAEFCDFILCSLKTERTKRGTKPMKSEGKPRLDRHTVGLKRRHDLQSWVAQLSEKGRTQRKTDSIFSWKPPPGIGSIQQSVLHVIF